VVMAVLVGVHQYVARAIGVFFQPLPSEYLVQLGVKLL